MSWRTGPNWLVFTEVDMEFDCNIMVLYCVTHSKIAMCWQQSSKRCPQKCPLFAWGKHHPTRLCITHQTLQSLWDLSSQLLLPFKSEGSPDGPLQCCTYNPSCRDSSATWILWKALFTAMPPVQLLSRPEWIKFLITETQRKWNHSLVLRQQMSIASAGPQAVRPQKMTSLAFSLTHRESSHCFALQIKSTKSAGFGGKIHQRPDVLCLTTKCSKLWTAILSTCGEDVLPPQAIPPQTSPQVKTELLPDTRTTIALWISC